MMKRTQVQLDDQIYEAVRRRAFDEHRSISAVVRDALAAGLSLRRRPTARKPDFRFLGSGRSRQDAGRPVSEHHDEALAEAVATPAKLRR